MDREVARQRIARDTQEAEQAVNVALLKNSKLFVTIVEARHETGSDPLLGHAELLRLAQSQEQLLGVAGKLGRVHGGLRKIQQDVTGYDDCPDIGRTGGASESEPVRLHA